MDSFAFAMLVILVLMTGAVIVGFTILTNKIDRIENQNVNLAQRLADAYEEISRVDESCGVEMHRVETKLDEFLQDHGEAMVEELRQAAKAEKAWTEGVNSILSYSVSGHE